MTDTLPESSRSGHPKANPEWLLFLAQLPATPSSLRVSVWRRLREAGAASLQNGVWVLPGSAQTAVFMERLLAYVRHSGATGQVLQVQAFNQAVYEELLARFQAERDQEYDEFLEQCDAFRGELVKETRQAKFTFAELEENEQNLQRLRKWLVKIQKRDFFKSGKSGQAMIAFQNCHDRLQDFTRQVYAREGIETPPHTDNLPGEDSLDGEEQLDDR